MKLVRLGPAGLRIRLLGGLVVEGVAERDLGSRKARTVIKVLALARGAPVSAASLADILWCDRLPARPAQQVGVLVSRLRRVLGADRLTRTEAGFSLAVEWLDVDELAARVVEAEAALGVGRIAAARAAATAALAVGHGPLLPDDSGAWLDAEQVTVTTAIGRAREVAAVAALRAGDHGAAAAAAEIALAHDSYDEAALRVLMRAHTASGRPASALAAYARVRACLAEDLGVSPAPDTDALHRAILTGEPPPGIGPDRAHRGERLIGRDDELDALHAHLAATSAGPNRLVIVQGEAGIGKTTLAATFADHARAAGCVVLGAQTDELGRDLPLQPLLDALGSGVVDHDVSGGLGEITVVTDPGAERGRWFAAVLDALGAVTDGHSVVLVIDDLHLADSATRAWLTWAARLHCKMLFVGTSRPGATLPGAHILAVGPLDVAAIGALVGASQAAAVHAESRGNPLVAIALATARPGELPVSVREAARRSAAGLGVRAAEVIQAAAVLGSQVDVDLLAGVLRQSAVDIIDHLEAATTAGLLLERGPGFAFRHELVRDALDGTASAARRALLHRLAGRLLDGRPGREPLAIGVHARLGGDLELAARSLVEAAQRSIARADVQVAEVHARDSIALAATAVGHETLARVLLATQRLDEAAAEAERAVSMSGGPAALEIAGWIAYYRRRHGEAQAFADEAAKRADRDVALRSSALALAGRVRHATGELSAAEAHLTAAADGPAAVRGVAEVWLGEVHLHQGRPDHALRALSRALVDPDHLAHPFAAVHGRWAVVVAYGQQGRVAAAVAACDHLERSVRAGGRVSARHLAPALNVRAWVLRGSGRFGEADVCNTVALEATSVGDGSGPASEALAEAYWVALLDLAEGRLVVADHAAAAELVDRLAPVDSWAGTMAWHQRHRLGLLRARLARADGDSDAAAGAALLVAADAEQRGAARYAALARVQLALAGGDTDAGALDEAVAVLDRCARLEGWWLAAELAIRFDVGRWRTYAEDAAARLVAGCDADDAAAARTMVDRALA